MQPELKQRLEQLLAESAAADPPHRGLRQRHERAGPPAPRAGARAVSGSDLVAGRAMPSNYVPEGVRYFEGHAASNVDGAASRRFLLRHCGGKSGARARPTERGHSLRAPRGMPRRARRREERLRRRGQPRQDDHVVDAHPRPAPGRPESLALHRRAGSAARHERVVDRGQALRGRGGRKRRHAGALLAAGQPHPQHRGGAPRLLSRHRGDRAGLRHAVRADARADRLLRGRQERDAALLARRAGR